MALRSVALGFKDIKYSVRVQKGETKQILHGITGLVNPTEMLCILGPSGSGKTSLIHIIGKKIKSDKTKDVTGQILCNDQELSPTQIMRISGFVSQEDVFNPELTVQETLKFAAWLRLPKHQRESRTDEVVKLLQLESCVKTHIGDDSNPYSKGISGGEKRRLAIALEILDPNISVLVLDEPTSGLDAAAALNVCNVLRSLADAGITIAGSLHQPRTSIMALFNKLMILAEGRRVYFGQVSEYVQYLTDHLECTMPPHESPYDLVLDLLNPAIQLQNVKPKVTAEKDKTIAHALADAFDRSALARRADAEAPASTSGVDRFLPIAPQEMRAFEVGSKQKVDDELLKSGKGQVSWMGKFITILHRTVIIKARDPMVLATQISTAIFIGLIFGALYWQTYEKDEDTYAILDTQMCITMTIVMCMFIPFDVTLTFPRERRVFLRERKAGLYPTTAFYMARILADMPMHIVAATIFSAIVYPMAQLRMGIHLFILVNVIAILVGAAVMQSIGALCRSFEEANVLMMPVMMMAMMTSTTFVRQTPDWLTWMRDISMMGLCSDIAMYWEFREVDAELGDPEEIMDSFGVLIRDDSGVWKAICILITIAMVARLITFLAVKFLHTGRSSFAENMAD